MDSFAKFVEKYLGSDPCRFEGSIDLDRLHNVISSTHHPRQSGRTYAACIFCVGVFELYKDVGTPITLTWSIPEYRWVYHIKHMLSDLLAERGFDNFFWRDRHLLVGNHHLILRLPQDEFLGIADTIQVDDLGECRDFLNMYQEFEGG